MAAINVSEEKGVRYLHFGSAWVQGAMRIARPAALELEYTRQMMAPLLVREDDWPRSVLQVGLGAASVTRFLLRHRPAARINVVEIREDVVAAARQFFKLPERSERLDVQIGEAHDYLAGARKRFDLILVDAFDEKGRSGMADSVPFYMNCRARLAPRGIAAFNLLTRTRGAAPTLARLREAFPAGLQPLPISEAGNLVVLAAASPPLAAPRADLAAAAARLKAQTGLDLRKMVSDTIFTPE